MASRTVTQRVDGEVEINVYYSGVVVHTDYGVPNSEHTIIDDIEVVGIEIFGERYDADDFIKKFGKAIFEKIEEWCPPDDALWEG